MRLRYPLFGLLCAIAGCFYPPTQQPLAQAKDQVTLALPYDLAWDAVNAVITDNQYRVIADDPNYGIIETQAPAAFTVTDADCGKLKSVAQKYVAKPSPDSSAVYNFSVKPQGPEATVVGVRGTFTSPLHIPLHPVRNFQCVSRGVQEARLLGEIVEQAKKTHRPIFKPPTD